MAHSAAEVSFAAKKASKKGSKIRDSLKAVHSCSMKIASDTRTNYISAKFHIASPLVAKLCEFRCRALP